MPLQPGLDVGRLLPRQPACPLPRHLELGALAGIVRLLRDCYMIVLHDCYVREAEAPPDQSDGFTHLPPSTGATGTTNLLATTPSLHKPPAATHLVETA